jgi:hypothetical protein
VFDEGEHQRHQIDDQGRLIEPVTVKRNRFVDRHITSFLPWALVSHESRSAREWIQQATVKATLAGQDLTQRGGAQSEGTSEAERGTHHGGATH